MTTSDRSGAPEEPVQSEVSALSGIARPGLVPPNQPAVDLHVIHDPADRLFSWRYERPATWRSGW